MNLSSGTLRYLGYQAASQVLDFKAVSGCWGLHILDLRLRRLPAGSTHPVYARRRRRGVGGLGHHHFANEKHPLDSRAGLSVLWASMDLPVVVGLHGSTGMP